MRDKSGVGDADLRITGQCHHFKSHTPTSKRQSSKMNPALICMRLCERRDNYKTWWGICRVKVLKTGKDCVNFIRRSVLILVYKILLN